MRTDIHKTLFKASWQIPCFLVFSFIVGFVFNCLRPEGLPLIGNCRDWSGLNTEDGQSLDISIAEAKVLHREKAVLFLDARNPDQYEAGHIQGALNLPWAEAEDRVFEIMEEIQTVPLIITYCDGFVCSMSHHLALFLIDMGLKNVRVFSGGWAEWEQNDLPISK